MRLLIYDATCKLRGNALTSVWWAGGHAYRAAGRFDHVRAVSSWTEALRWMASVPGEQIDEVQYWGHGNWGCARIGADTLDGTTLAGTSSLQGELRSVRDRLRENSSLWFRTCETFGANRGHDFARRCADYFGCAVAGHTFIIWFWQSGLHVIRPGSVPDWAPSEGLAEGTADEPRRALWSGPRRPNTVTCLRGTLRSMD